MIIYGKEGCSRCEQIKKMHPDAEAKDIMDIYDRFEPDKASKMITASNGKLPIITIGGHAFGPLEEV